MSRLARRVSLAIFASATVVLISPNVANAAGLSLPSGNYAFACDPANDALLMNRVPVTKAGVTRRCAEISSLDLIVGTTGTTAVSKVDLRGVAFATTVNVFGSAVIHGSAGPDRIEFANGRAYGYGGADTITAGNRDYGDTSISSTVFGGDDADYIACSKVDDPVPANCTIDAGAGNDYLNVVGTGSAKLGDGDDVVSFAVLLASSTSQTMTVDGGPGVDTSYIEGVVDGVGRLDPLNVGPGVATGSLVVNRRARVDTMMNVESPFVIVHEGTPTIVTMSPTIRITLKPERSFVEQKVTVKVPGGVWTQTASGVTAPGLAKVRFNSDLTKGITVIAA
jgi:hypothetical protein